MIILLLLTSFLQATSAFASMRSTSVHASFSIVIEVPEDFPTIQQAIDAAPLGTTILVHNGTYPENLVINKTIELIGDDPSSTTIDGSTADVSYSPTITVYSSGDAENVKIANFTITGSKKAWGISIFFSTSNSAWIENNIITNNSGGININAADSCTLINNTVTNNQYEGILFMDCSNNTMKNNTLAGNPYNFGIYFNDFDHNIDTTNTINGKPIHYIKNETDLIINSATYPNIGYLALVNCTNITVEDLMLQNNINGLLLANTIDSTIRNNIISNNSRGLEIINSQNVTVQGNNITDNTWQALTLDNSPSNRLMSNRLSNNLYNFRIEGTTLNDFTQDIDTTNTVDGRLIRYMINNTGLTINPTSQPNTGHLILVHCQNITAENLSLEHSDILVAFTQNSTITQNTITSGSIILTHSSSINATGNVVTAGDTGISLKSTENSTLTENMITGCADWGIQLETSSSNALSDNNVKNNTSGINLYSSSNNNTLFRNNIADSNTYGVLLTDAHYNLAYHNNFINPAHYQVVCSYSNMQSVSDNYFDNGYPSGGNYWVDYNGTDQYSGPEQNMTGSDGIGDSRYEILYTTAVRDRYPLLHAIQAFDAGTWQNETFKIELVSNSTVSDFNLNETAETLSFNVTGLDGTHGYCRITIPNIIAQILWTSDLTVQINGQPQPFRNWTDTQNIYIYVNYAHSTKEIVITPENLTPAAIVTILTAATLITIAVRRIRRKRYGENDKIRLSQNIRSS